MLEANPEFILLCISKVEADYHSKVKDIIENTRIYDFNSFVNLSNKVSETYFNTCGQLLGIVVEYGLSEHRTVFTFDDYSEKRTSLKVLNDSVLDELYLKNLASF